MCVGQRYVGVGGVYEQARSLRRDRLLFSKANGVSLALLFGGNLLLGVRKADGLAVLGKVFACGLWAMGVDVDDAWLCSRVTVWDCHWQVGVCR